jgi:hypothetical protein
MSEEVKELILMAILPEWQISEEDFGIVVTPPSRTANQKELQSLARTEAWRLARKLGFSKFTSIEKTKEGGHLVYSKDESGKWFQILVVTS